jgi:DNA-directed RNA polymerase specialized sigma24 family protein
MADYENFVREQLPRLLRYARMLTGEREQAADLVQDVLVKALPPLVPDQRRGTPRPLRPADGHQRLPVLATQQVGA